MAEVLSSLSQARRWLAGFYGLLITLFASALGEVLKNGADSIATWTTKQWLVHLLLGVLGAVLTMISPVKAPSSGT